MNTFHTLSARLPKHPLLTQRFGAFLRRVGQEFSRGFFADLLRDAFGGGGRIGELLHEREDLCDQLELRDQTIEDQRADIERLKETLESTSRAYQERGEEIQNYQRMSTYRIGECNRLQAEVAHYKAKAEQNEAARHKRLDTLAALATGMRTGAPNPLN